MRKRLVHLSQDSATTLVVCEKIELPQAPHLNFISCVALSTSGHCSMYEPLWVVTVVYKINPTTHCFFPSTSDATASFGA